jgi:sulfur-oxidizing protein SoxY
MTTRREFLVAGLAGGILGSAGAGAQTASAPMQEAIRRVVGSSPVRPGRVKLDVPPLLDNGNAVPLAVSVESPMTRADHVKAIHVFTEKNPLPHVLSVFLGPRSARASFSTRVRIADSGAVTAIAQMSDGSFWSDSVKVVVTLSACLEEGLI